MKQPSNLMRRMGGQAVISGQPLPGIPIVELAGDRRVLIENHFGIQEYLNHCVKVSVGFGCVWIEGSGLEIVCMSANQLVVTGIIESVKLERGRK